MDDKPFDQETHEIIGAAIDVHRCWGPGYLEAVYHRSLEIELGFRGLPARREVPFPLAYRGVDLGTVYRADLVSGDVLVEVKAHAGLMDADVGQVVHYLRCSGLSRALLLNFGLPRLQIKRIVLGSDWMASVRSVNSVFESSDDATSHVPQASS